MHKCRRIFDLRAVRSFTPRLFVRSFLFLVVISSTGISFGLCISGNFHMVLGWNFTPPAYHIVVICDRCISDVATINM